MSISWLQMENVTLNASPNDDVITVNGTLPSTAMRINAPRRATTRSTSRTPTCSRPSPSLPVTATRRRQRQHRRHRHRAGDLPQHRASYDSINIGIGGRLALAGAVVPELVRARHRFPLDRHRRRARSDEQLDGARPPRRAEPVRHDPQSHRLRPRRRAWTGSGITSFGAFIANPKNTTLGMLTSGEYFQIYGFGTDFAGVEHRHPRDLHQVHLLRRHRPQRPGQLRRLLAAPMRASTSVARVG